MIDIWKGFRTNWRICTYYNVDGRSGDYSKLLHSLKPSGTFHAKEVSSASEQNNYSNNVVQSVEDLITLETNDDINIIENAIVIYQNEKWIVSAIQKTIHRKESQYIQKMSYTYTLTLRK